MLRTKTDIHDKKEKLMSGIASINKKRLLFQIWAKTSFER